MEFITAEQFLDQPEEIQEVFLKWWKPQFGDIFATKKIYDEIDIIINYKNGNIYGIINTFECIHDNYVDMTLIPFPLLTEGQIRKFIEERKNGKIDLNHGIKGYSISVYKSKNVMELIDSLDTKEHDLLQAYWQVACKIAKETIGNKKELSNNGQ